MRQAVPATLDELDLAHLRRAAERLADRVHADSWLRAGLIYDRRGVLDMTRRHKEPAHEEIVGWIGGART